MPFTIIRQDITKMKVDAIVNAANTDLAAGGGVCGAIFAAAGAEQMQDACNRVAPVKTGGAALTPGFALPCKYVIHAAGPVYRHWSPAQSEEYLRSAYRESLHIAVDAGCGSIAFPLISSGIYGYPKDEALRIASDEIQLFLAAHDTDVYLVVFDRESYAVGEKLMGGVAAYIDENYVGSHRISRSMAFMVQRNESEVVEEDARASAPRRRAKKPVVEKPLGESGIDSLLGNLDESFSVTLLRLIDAKGKSDVDVYRGANLDRRLFSKIRAGKGYMPGKRTILALAISLKLTLAETDDLLERAGYALSHSQKADVIVEYFIINGKYNIHEINEVLFGYDLPLLGGNAE